MCCPHFAFLAVADVESSLDTDAIGKAAAALIGAAGLAAIDGWLDRQIDWLRANSPDLRLVLVVDLERSDKTKAVRALITRSDVQGYIPTSTNTAVAKAALDLVVAGGHYFPKFPVAPASIDLSEMIMWTEAFAMLTPYEKAVLRALAGGARNRDIADRLGMSVSTVEAHVHSIVRKLNVRDRTEVAVAIRRG
jgi:DNA-binding NarL/FixJ family response regulator